MYPERIVFIWVFITKKVPLAHGVIIYWMGYLAHLKYMRRMHLTSMYGLMWDIDTKTVETRRKVSFFMKQIVEINFLPISGSMSHIKKIPSTPSIYLVSIFGIVVSPIGRMVSKCAPHAVSSCSQRTWNLYPGYSMEVPVLKYDDILFQPRTDVEFWIHECNESWIPEHQSVRRVCTTDGSGTDLGVMTYHVE
jgi:hypothetical protein